MNDTPRRPWRAALMALTVTAALAYLVWIVSGNWAETRGALVGMSPVLVGLALVPALLMYLAKAWYHALIVRQLHPAWDDRVDVMAAYCQAQIVRYLPGKLWGLVYQAGRLHQRVPARHVLVANVVQTLYTQLFAVGFCAVVLLAELTGHRAWLWLLPAGVLVTAALHRSTLLERGGLAVVQRWSPEPLSVPARPAFALGAQVVALLVFDWVVFCAVWLLLADGRLDLWPAVVMAACYSIASLLATLAVVVPAGLVLREALFISLGQRLDFGADELFAYGIVARVVFTAAEAACLPVLALWASLRRTRGA